MARAEVGTLKPTDLMGAIDLLEVLTAQAAVSGALMGGE